MLIPIEDGGKIVWAWDAPDVCPAGHADGTVMRWGRCPRCRHYGLAWECRRPDCGATAMDWDHVCPRISPPR